ncbi:MAG: WYL domain-containing protein [Deferribacteraceae bacterium]|jgi:hypothetical protein|nr:WYL domain-containing protein [Deferribacteraceae bacterium]
MIGLDKALRLLNHLASHGSVDSKSIVELFSTDEKKISIRTAQRYMEDLRNLPDVTDNGDGSLSLAGKSVYQKYIDPVVLAVARANIGNLRDLFDERRSADVNDIKKRLGTNGEKLFARSESSINFSVIEPFVNNLMEYIQDSVIEITSIRGKIHTVQPYLILIEKGFWYLVGYNEDHKNIQYFRLDNIKSFKPVFPTRFFTIDETKLNKIKRAKTVFSGDESEVIIHVAPEIAHYFKSKEILSGQRILSDNKKGLKVSMFATHEWDFILQILPWTHLARVETKYYRDVLADYLKNALEKNS